MSIVTGTGGGTGGADSFFDTFTGTKNTDLTSATVSVSGTIGGHSLSTPEISSTPPWSSQVHLVVEVVV